MYAAIIRKKAKVPGTESKHFVNYLAYIISGSIGLGFAGWIYFTQETPTNEGLERFKNHWLMKRVINDILAPEFTYGSPKMIAAYMQEREATEKVYETYQKNHGEPEEKQQ